jgi:hypothetical protein
LIQPFYKKKYASVNHAYSLKNHIFLKPCTRPLSP